MAKEQPSSSTGPPLAVVGGVGGPVARILEQRPLITGEDPADYDCLLARLGAAVAPEDAIEWLWLKDVVDLAWEVQRWRRLRAALLMTARTEAMARVLLPLMGYEAAGETAWDWARGNTQAARRAETSLADHGLGVDAVMAAAFSQCLGDLESIERMIAAAELRRDRILNQIEKRRQALAWRRREAAVIDIEDEMAPSR
ncbi:MAG: hypothetical protein ACE5KF_12625, partial [Kiloniellaceae bacterium]